MDKSAKEPLQKRQRCNSTAEPSSLWSSAITLGLLNEQEVELSSESMGRGASSRQPEGACARRPVESEPESEPTKDSRPPSITLCGGFAKVEHKKYYGPDTIAKGKKIVDHVANIREVRTWNTASEEYDSVITATCLREMNITNHPYNTRLVLDRERKVTDAYCWAKVLVKKANGPRLLLYRPL